MLKETNIKEFVKAKINLTTLSGPSQKVLPAGPQGPASAIYGQAIPLVVINGIEIQASMLINVDIDCLGFLPKISITLDLVKNKNYFFSTSFPRTGDIVSLFIRSPNDNLKPIRNDYEIITINYIGSVLPGDSGASAITITGRLFIPGFYSNKTFSIEGTGFNALKKIATELSLGFASNIDDTNDSMRWLGVGNYEDFIRSVTNHLWKSEDSFFNSFVDFYYNLNVIDVNRQFSFSIDGQPGVISDLNVRQTDQNSTVERQLKVFHLTNDPRSSDFNNFITNFNIINNSAFIAAKEGITKDFRFYDFATKTIVSDELPAMVTPDAPSTVTPQSEMKTMGTRPSQTWLGVQYSDPIGNVHKNYKFAKMINNFNLNEIDKIILETRLANPNLFLHRGQRLPILIYNYGDPAEFLSSQNPTIKFSEKVNGLINTFLTGFYYVKGYQLTYNSNIGPGFVQRVYLTKREWETSRKRQ